jgi:hypothetical protein
VAKPCEVSVKPRTSQFSVDQLLYVDLLRLVNLQSAIIDTQRSLSKVIKNLDALYAPSDVNWLVSGSYTRSRLSVLKFPCGALAFCQQVREISERERRVADWQTAEAQVRVEAESCKTCFTPS